MSDLNLIIDNKTSYKSFNRIRKLNPSNILLFDLGNNIEYINKLRHFIRPECNIKRIDLNSEKLISSKILQEDYINFISNLSKIKINSKKNINLKNFLFFDDISYWWLTTIAEKNPLKRNTYFKINILHNLIASIKKYNFTQVYIDIEDREISSSLVKNLTNSFNILKYKKAYPEFLYFFYALFNSLRLFTRLLLRSVLCKVALFNAKTSDKSYDFTLISSYRDRSSNKIENPYFQTLIEEMDGNDTQYKNLYMLEGLNHKKNISDLISLKKNSPIDSFDIIDRYITFFDLFQILKRLSVLMYKLIFVKKILKNNLNFLEIDVQNLFIGDIFISFIGQTAIDNLYKDIIFRKYFYKNLNDKKIVYPLEMQAWEKIMNNHKNRYSLDITSYGIQHVPVSFLMLNYYYNSIDLIDEMPIDMPLPDKALLFSDSDYKIFENMGWPRNKLINFGAIRFQKFINSPENSWLEKEDIVAVVLPGDINQCIEMIESIFPSILEITNINFYITHHPQIKDISTSAATKLTNLKNCFNSSKGTDDLAKKSKIMITYGTSAVIPGIINLCFIIIPVLPSSLPLDPAFNRIDSVNYFHDGILIKKAIINISSLVKAPDVLLQLFNKREYFLKLRDKKLYLEALNHET